MTIQKKKLMSLVKSLPNKINIDDFIYQLYVQKKIELAKDDVKFGRTLSHKQVVREAQKWFR